MYKKFAGQVGILILINLVIKFIWVFVIERKLQLTVGFDNYGIFYSLFNFTLILSVLTDPGLSNYIVRFLAADNKFKNQGLLSLKILLSCLYFLMTIVAAYFAGYNNDYFQLLVILAIYQILWSFLIYLRSYLKGLQYFNSEIFFSVADKVLLIFFFAPLLYGNFGIRIDVFLFATAQVMALVISILICLVFIKYKHLPVFNFKNYRPDFSVLKQLLPFSLFTFLVLAHNKTDVVMLERLLKDGDKEAGIYAAAYRIFDASNMMAILFASLFLPIVTKLIKEKHNILQLVKDSFEVLISLSLIISFSCWFYQTEIMNLFYGNKSSEYLARIFGILMFCSPLVVLYYVFSTVLTANNNLKILNLISFSGLILNIILNLFLIPVYGALGVAYSAFCSLLFTGVAYATLYKIFFKASFNQILLVKILMIMLLSIAIGIFLKSLQLNWFISISLFILILLLLTIFLRLISLKKLIMIFQENHN